MKITRTQIKKLIKEAMSQGVMNPGEHYTNKAELLKKAYKLLGEAAAFIDQVIANEREEGDSEYADQLGRDYYEVIEDLSMGLFGEIDAIESLADMHGDSDEDLSSMHDNEDLSVMSRNGMQ